ncbi:BsaA family SipW-dependent biofilm matrix protein [Enterococcus sp. AZ072]|uniref:BsaA family SipW-dependent biofilm matrix protein n=1 Tax=unclassified Enterococcus TaxID=2608891 RepID=UPI003D2792B0
MNQKEKRKHLFQTFVHSKGLFACFSLVLSLLLVVGSTYAWITSADERVNRTDANQRKLSAVVEEDFTQVFHWSPGTSKKKEIRVTNNGEVPAIVRLSLHEFFVSFETNVADNHRENPAVEKGNGNLVVYPATSVLPNNTIKVKETTTWKVNNYYSVYANKYYKVNQAICNPVDDHSLAYVYNDTGRTMPLKAMELNFQTTKLFDQAKKPIAGDADYWYYEKGYFYYSEILQPNESTEDLLESVTLNPAYANQYKGALYKLVPLMDAHDITKSLISDWGITSTDFAYDMYQTKLH